MGAILISLPTVIFSGVLLGFGDWLLWVSTIGLNVVAALLYLLRRLWLHCYCKNELT